jgi:hypothetical protein
MQIIVFAMSAWVDFQKNEWKYNGNHFGNMRPFWRICEIFLDALSYFYTYYLYTVMIFTKPCCLLFLNFGLREVKNYGNFS